MSIYLITLIALVLAFAGARAILTGRERALTIGLTGAAIVALTIQGMHGLLALMGTFPPEAWQLNWFALAAGFWSLICIGLERWADMS